MLPYFFPLTLFCPGEKSKQDQTTSFTRFFFGRKSFYQFRFVAISVGWLSPHALRVGGFPPPSVNSSQPTESTPKRYGDGAPPFYATTLPVPPRIPFPQHCVRLFVPSKHRTHVTTFSTYKSHINLLKQITHASLVPKSYGVQSEFNTENVFSFSFFLFMDSWIAIVYRIIGLFNYSEITPGEECLFPTRLQAMLQFLGQSLFFCVDLFVHRSRKNRLFLCCLNVFFCPSRERDHRPPGASVQFSGRPLWNKRQETGDRRAQDIWVEIHDICPVYHGSRMYIRQHQSVLFEPHDHTVWAGRMF